MQYRPEIDGLRAVAVVPVVLFHAGFQVFAGGFVGVDVFFVISGYLITTIIHDEVQRGAFSLRTFYLRRARRITPALLVVSAACVPAAWFLLLPSDTRDFAQSVLAAQLFVSNVLFWLQSGYFDTASSLKPLLNTWSLSVEGQFYALFPLLFLGLWRHGGAGRVRLVLAILALVSLIAAQWTTQVAPAAAFYLLPTRAWELLLGALVALYMVRVPTPWTRRGPAWLAGALALAGLMAIVGSVLTMDATTPFPGVHALVPTLGAALIILFAGPGTLVWRVLTQRVPVAIGMISYSLYLWHYPLFVFHRWTRLDTAVSTSERLLLIALAVLLAWVTWFAVERPFRRRARGRLFRGLKASVLGATGVFVGLLGSYMMVEPAGHDRMRLSYPDNVVWRSLAERVHAEGPVCTLGPLEGRAHTLGCPFGAVDGQRTVVLLGDSHSEALAYALDGELRNRGLRGLRLATAGCEPLPFIRRNRDLSVTDCDLRTDELLETIRALDADVVMLNRWSFRLYPIAGAIDDMPYRNSEGTAEREEYREYEVWDQGGFHADGASKRIALTRFLSNVAGAARHMVLIDPIPESAIDVALENAIAFRRDGTIVQDISFPRQDYTRRNAFVLSVFGALTAPNVTRVATEPMFCGLRDPDRCYVQHDTVPLYYDDDHLSQEGAARVVAAFADRLAAP